MGTKKTTLTHEQLFQVSDWMVAHRNELDGLPIQAMIDSISEGVGFTVSRSTVETLAKVREIEFLTGKPPSNRPTRVLAKFLAAVIFELGAEVPESIDLIAAGQPVDGDRVHQEIKDLVRRLRTGREATA